MKKFLLLLIIPITIIIIVMKPSKIYLTDKYYNKGNFIKKDSLSTIKNDSYILYTFNPFCSFPKPCEDVFKSFMTKYKIDMIYMPFSSFKKTDLYKKIKYAPSVIIVKKGKIVSYLDANSDNDIEKYQKENVFTTWIKNYIYLEKAK